MEYSNHNSALSYVDELTKVLEKVDKKGIDEFSEVLFNAWSLDAHVFVYGNGGSASTASHHVCDYIKTAAVGKRRRLKAVSLVDNVGLTTAIGNDLDYDKIFSYALESYAREGDVAVAISCSGNSANVVNACVWAKENGLKVVALTGFTGGALKEIADLNIHVPCDNYGIIEDIHLSVGHIVSQTLKTAIEMMPDDRDR